MVSFLARTQSLKLQASSLGCTLTDAPSVDNDDDNDDDAWSSNSHHTALRPRQTDWLVR